MRTKWLLLIVAIVAVVSACRPYPNGVTRDNPGAVEKYLIIKYDVLNNDIVSVEAPFTKKTPKRHTLPSKCDSHDWNESECTPQPDEGTMHQLKLKRVIHVISDFASPGCVCYDSWCVCD